MFHRTFDPEIFRKVDNESSLVEAMLWFILYMGCENEITRSLGPQTVTVVITKSIMGSLPKVTSTVRPDNDLILFYSIY